MRCLSCNKELTDFEATRRFSESKDFVDLCNGCFKHIEKSVNVTERNDLRLNDYDETEEDI